MDSFTSNTVFFVLPIVKNMHLSLTVFFFKENAFYIATAQLKNQGNRRSYEYIVCLLSHTSYR